MGGYLIVVRGDASFGARGVLATRRGDGVFREPSINWEPIKSW